MFLRKLSEIKDDKNFLKRGEVDHSHTSDKYPLHFELVFGIITTLHKTYDLTNANYPFDRGHVFFCHFSASNRFSRKSLWFSKNFSFENNRQRVLDMEDRYSYRKTVTYLSYLFCNCFSVTVTSCNVTRICYKTDTTDT